MPDDNDLDIDSDLELGNPDNLPAQPIVKVPALDPVYVDGETTDNEFDIADAQISHVVLSALLQGWSEVYTVDDICKLSTATMKALATRRQLFGKQKVPEGAKGKTIMYPIGT